MKSKKLIKKIEKFKKEKESCYCYLGEGNFYSSAFIIPILKANEEVIVHNGMGDINGFKILEKISIEEFKKRINLLVSYDTLCDISKINCDTTNVVYSSLTEFNKDNGDLYNNRA